MDSNSAAGTAYRSGASEFNPVFKWVCVDHSLILFNFLCSILSTNVFFCSFFIGHSIICPSSIDDFWLPL